MNSRPKTDPIGALLGIVTFLGGVALLTLTFRLAYDLFTTPPSRALGAEPGKPLDMAVAGQSLTQIVVRLLLLLIMSLVGAVIANRGVKLYLASRLQTHAQAPGQPKDSTEPPKAENP